MSSRRSGAGGRKRNWPRTLPAPPAAPPTPRQQWDAACARFIDAVMTNDPEQARIALAESFVALGYLDVTP